MTFKEFEAQNRDLINEFLLPIGLVIALALSIWVASQ